ncbi:MAG: hypothetical protein J6F30_13150 [Cellulosilyticum sp.]|nr:hypothetical protein [Cellulosilyticum sp.]
MKTIKPNELTEASNKKLAKLIRESKQAKNFYEAKQRENKPRVRIRKFD